MNNKVKFAFAIGTFIILVMVGFYLMQERNDVVFYADEQIKPQNICVYVVGEVNSPGVFEVIYGTRIHEVIELAGGANVNADLSRINLAKIVDDEEKINIPRIIMPEVDESLESGLININSASVEKLSSLTGIGESTAEKIVKFREENGYFNSIEEIMNVSGIGESKFNAIKDDIEI